MIPIQHIHPMVIHFPIVFIFCLAVFDLVAVAMGRTVTGRTVAGNISTTIAVLAGASAVVAAMFGDMALEYAQASGFHSSVAEIHQGLGITTATGFAIWGLIRLFLWWRDTRLTGGMAYVVPLVAILGAVLVTATAYFGGELVYHLGVNVAKA